MQRDNTNKFMEEDTNLKRKLNESEHQLKEKYGRFDNHNEDSAQLDSLNKGLEKSLKDMETRLEEHVNVKKINEKTLKEQEQSLKDLEKHLEQKEHERQKFEELSNTQKDVISKLKEEKENLERRLNQAEQQLKNEQSRIFQFIKLDEEEKKYLEHLFNSSKLKYDLSEMAGLDDIKNEIREKILEPLKNPDKQLTKGVLIHGATACGKTELVCATAKSAGIPIFPYIAYRFKGDLTNIIPFLRKIQPVILYGFSDFTNKKDEPNLLKKTKEWLKEIKPEDKIIVMIQADYIENIKPDILNIFPLKFGIHLPDKDRRIGLIKIFLEKNEIRYDIDLDELSNILMRYDCSSIETICDTASERAKERRGDNAIVNMEDMDFAIREEREERMAIENGV